MCEIHGDLLQVCVFLGYRSLITSSAVVSSGSRPNLRAKAFITEYMRLSKVSRGRVMCSSECDLSFSGVGREKEERGGGGV